MLAIIPARGGSKGLTRKNIRSLGGKPLILWTIEEAKNSKSLNHIVLSTDDEEIAQICKHTGIDIPFMRPSELAQDDSLAIDNYIYTVDRLNEEFNYNYNEFVVLLPTTPLRKSFDIEGAISVFNEKDSDSVISVTCLHFPADWIFRLSKDGTMNSLIKENLIMNRQDHERYFIPNGGVYVLRNELLKKNRSYFSQKTYPFKMPYERSVDIDTEFDFKLAEYLISKNG